MKREQSNRIESHRIVCGTAFASLQRKKGGGERVDLLTSTLAVWDAGRRDPHGCYDSYEC